jgi:serine/threonine protein kinase
MVGLGPDARIVNYPPGAKSIARSGYSVIYEHPDRPNQVCKVPRPWPEYEAAHEVERRIFRRLGEHPNLIKVIDMDEYGIWLERAVNGSLTEYYAAVKEKPDMHQRLQWCEDVAHVLTYVHEKNVRHADISGTNLLIDADMRILLCDFAGSYIDGERATIAAPAGYCHPDAAEWKTPTIRGELHTFGSTIYEIITGNGPYRNLGLESEEIERLIEKRQYPDVSDIDLGDVIKRCWNGDFLAVSEVEKEIRAYRRLRASPETSAC